MAYAKQKIGGVQLLKSPVEPSATYSDNEFEDMLLAIFSSSNPGKRIEEVLNNNPSWPMYYHLTPKRSNLFRWYEFESNTDILEIGAGCGAITEELVRREDCTVTALELMEKRALINARRNRASGNLTIVVDNIDSYKPQKKFDYIVCVGVLEYAGTFFNTKRGDPYSDFASSLAALLKPGGKLLLAIENRLGLKYWSGAKEDHQHTFFEGHNGYPGHKAVQTFGRRELADLLTDSGFSSSYFYYPFPDYKTPSLVYSDDFYPGNGTEFPLSKLPAPTLDRQRFHFFSEQSVMRYLEANDLFPDFSNSFLVEATI